MMKLPLHLNHIKQRLDSRGQRRHWQGESGKKESRRGLRRRRRGLRRSRAKGRWREDEFAVGPVRLQIGADGVPFGVWQTRTDATLLGSRCGVKHLLRKGVGVNSWELFGDGWSVLSNVVGIGGKVACRNTPALLLFQLLDQPVPCMPCVPKW